MVERSGRYYDTQLEGSGGVTQGNLLSLIISNMVVDAVICHWATVVEEEEAGQEGFWREVQTLSVLFFANDGLLFFTFPSMLQ